MEDDVHIVYSHHLPLNRPIVDYMIGLLNGR